jgi:outer membrane protein assembly factor BamB
MRVWSRLAGTLGICLLAVLELFYVYGMRVEWNGDMQVQKISFASRRKHYARLEESRERQRAEAPPATAPVAAPATSAPAKETAPEKARPVSYWTDFRGPNRAGTYSETSIDTAWPAAGLPRLWKQPVGGGYASFSVGEGRAYTIEQRRDKEAITAYDVETGRELWAFTYPALFDEVLGGPGPRATPVYFEGLIYSLGANGDF